MPNVFVDDASLQAIAGAIRAKNGSTATYKPGQMAAAIQGIESGGMEINGALRTYQVAADETVAAGDFVQFVNQYERFTERKPFYEKTGSSLYVDGVLLPNGRIFLANASGSDDKLQTIVAEVRKDGSVAVIKNVLLSEEPYSRQRKVLLLDDGRILLLHTMENTNYSMYGAVITVSENGDIDVATDTLLSNTYRSAYYNSLNAVQVENGCVYISYRAGTNVDMYGMVVKVNSDGSITAGTETKLTVTTNAAGGIIGNYNNAPCNAVCIRENKVLVVFGHGQLLNSSYRKSIIVTVNDDRTITAGNIKTISDSQWMGGGISTKLFRISGNRFLLIYQRYSGACLAGAIITVGENDIVTVERDEGLKDFAGNEIKGSSASSIIINLNEDRAFIAIQYSYQTPKLITAKVNSENVITVQTISQDVGEMPGMAMLLDDGRILMISQGPTINNVGDVMYRHSEFDVGQYLNEITGIAKTGGSAGKTIEVYEPN